MLSCLTIRVCAQRCETGKLDPRVSAVLKSVIKNLQAPSATLSIEQIREVSIPPVGSFPLSDVRNMKITEDSIPIQIYNPLHATELPIIISYHPGGFVTPILPFMEYEFWRQAKAYNAIVVAVDYRIAPENMYPAAVNDAYNAFKWVTRHGKELGGDTSRIVLLGVSAGGNLAAVVSQKAKKDGLARKIKLQILNCPSTDNPLNNAKYPSYHKYASGYFLTKEFCLYYIQAYAPGVSVNNPEVAPVNENDLSGLPPALVMTAEFDPLRDEGDAYAENLRKARVPVISKCFQGQIHCLVGLPPDAAELAELDELVVNAMNTFVR